MKRVRSVFDHDSVIDRLAERFGVGAGICNKQGSACASPSTRP